MGNFISYCIVAVIVAVFGWGTVHAQAVKKIPKCQAGEVLDAKWKKCVSKCKTSEIYQVKTGLCVPVKPAKSSLQKSQPATSSKVITITNIPPAQKSAVPSKPWSSLQPKDGGVVNTAQSKKATVYDKLLGECLGIASKCPKQFNILFLNSSIIASDFARLYVSKPELRPALEAAVSNVPVLANTLYSKISLGNARDIVQLMLVERINLLKAEAAKQAAEKGAPQAGVTKKGQGPGMNLVADTINKIHAALEAMRGVCQSGSDKCNQAVLGWLNKNSNPPAKKSPYSWYDNGLTSCINAGSGPSQGASGSRPGKGGPDPSPIGTTVDPDTKGPKPETTSGKKDFSGLGQFAPCEGIDFNSLLAGSTAGDPPEGSSGSGKGDGGGSTPAPDSSAITEKSAGNSVVKDTQTGNVTATDSKGNTVTGKVVGSIEFSGGTSDAATGIDVDAHIAYAQIQGEDGSITNVKVAMMDIYKDGELYDSVQKVSFVDSDQVPTGKTDTVTYHNPGNDTTIKVVCGKITPNPTGDAASPNGLLACKQSMNPSTVDCVLAGLGEDPSSDPKCKSIEVLGLPDPNGASSCGHGANGLAPVEAFDIYKFFLNTGGGWTDPNPMDSKAKQGLPSGQGTGTAPTPKP